MASSQLPADIADTEAAVPTEMSAEQKAAAGAPETECEDAGASLTESPDAAEATEAEEKDKRLEELKAKWPAWPGYSVFRLVVPVLKVGGIIGRKGDLVKKLVEETRARIRVLDGPLTSPDRIVLISGKEEPDSALPPAMDAIIRIFKRVSGLPDNDGDGSGEAAGATFCVIRLLVPSVQAISLIGKQGCVIKSIQETSGASVRVLSNEVKSTLRFYLLGEDWIMLGMVSYGKNTLSARGNLTLSNNVKFPRTQFSLPYPSGELNDPPHIVVSDEIPIYANSEERFVELQGEALKVRKALEAVVGHLRKFLVDQSVLPLFEKSYNAPPATQERQVDSFPSNTLLHATPRTSSAGDNYPVSVKRDSIFLERDNQMDTHMASSRHSLYEAEYGLGVRSSTFGRSGGPVIVQTMQIPLAYAEDIIGVQGANIDYIRRSSGATLTVQESATPEEITVEIKGTSSQVQAAQQLIQEFIGGHKESLPGSYGQPDPSLRSSYSHQLGSSSYPTSSFAEQPYSSYGSSGVGRYDNYRL
ncbi:poly(rc)-binding protein 2 [Phtheirospermum japonicum]|uniref:Poly(Rc)-binding protein 2 n=1 Tax=Phtheirospermum japonicum TaxID=374723 RepID=A0A830D8S6_9LAMI|nr:poly(rc)-binding protein 2 [Phtheirospermum japonicum]